MAPKKQAAPSPEYDLELRFGRTKNTLKMGVVGLPNVGKSSFFNLLTSQEIEAQNFPFCTINPNFGRTQVWYIVWNVVSRRSIASYSVNAEVEVSGIILVVFTPVLQSPPSAYPMHLLHCTIPSLPVYVVCRLHAHACPRSFIIYDHRITITPSYYE